MRSGGLSHLVWLLPTETDRAKYEIGEREMRFAHLRGLTNSERSVGEADHGVERLMVRLRWDGVSRRIRSGWRIEDGEDSETWDVVQARDPDGKRREIVVELARAV